MKVYHFKTVANNSEYQIKEKNSKFIGLCVPCSTEDEAKKILKEWHLKYYQATHICYAYRFGINKIIYRANDDGEPSNSAGIPILNQISSFGITNVLIGVVRYYGGIKLGVGGLVSAYKLAAKKTIEENLIIDKELCSVLKISFSFEEMPIILNKIKTKKIKIISQIINQNCSLTFKVSSFQLENLKKELLKQNSLKIEDVSEEQ